MSCHAHEFSFCLVLMHVLCCYLMYTHSFSTLMRPWLDFVQEDHKQSHHTQRGKEQWLLQMLQVLVVLVVVVVLMPRHLQHN